MTASEHNGKDWYGLIRTVVVIGSVVIATIAFFLKVNTWQIELQDTVVSQEKHLEYIDKRLDQIDNRMDNLQNNMTYVKKGLKSHGITPRGDEDQ